MSAPAVRSGLEFVNALNLSAVTFVRDLGEYGWTLHGETFVSIGGAGSPVAGWEAISPWGEVRAFASYGEARAWRNAECRAYVLGTAALEAAGALR